MDTGNLHTGRGYSSLRRTDVFLLAALTAIATLNRETGLLVPGAFVALRWPDVRRGGYARSAAVVSVITWACFYWLVRLIQGDHPSELGPIDLLEINLSTLPKAIQNNIWFLPIWLLVIYNVRRAAPAAQRLVLVALGYAGIVAIMGTWHEVRLWLPVIILVLPIAFGAFKPASTHAS